QAYRQRHRVGDCAKALEVYKQFIVLDPTSEQRAVAEGFVTEMQACALREAPPPPPPPPPPPVPTPTRRRPIAHASVETHPVRRIVGLAVAGGGVVLVATGIYFGNKASSLGEEVTTGCSAGCNWANFASKDAEGHRAQDRQW